MTPLLSVWLDVKLTPQINKQLLSDGVTFPFPTAWITGRAAEYMETLGEEEVGLACQTMMSHFLQAEVPAPSKVIRYVLYIASII